MTWKGKCQQAKNEILMRTIAAEEYVKRKTTSVRNREARRVGRDGGGRRGEGNRLRRLATVGPGPGGSRLRIQVSTRPTARQAAETGGGRGGEDQGKPKAWSLGEPAAK